ncbi:CDP-alcohol phosphatidyltransferase family protein [Szabonella alba]|uniref:CDP-alcohol phosphatidyltransferase family protein n=1 Tax=Szabonella alba TaxID=2804194 RepID=A0A8K0Y2F0_9RHOB|nr:CDP-alcohol phosphatidyltransferase family protein [Szabonella alba]MBL4919247.1 CDP-alcohol phosphatidyltransferase family protein [Szabonella alba]
MAQLRSAARSSPSPQGTDVSQFAGSQLARLGMAFVVLTWGGAIWLGAAPGGFALATGGYALGLGLTLTLFRRGFPHPTLGACNMVTLARLALTAALLAPLASGPAPPMAMFTLAMIALSLDGLDGWLARRAAWVSGFGARFDMEVDSGLALLLALNAWAAGMAGPAVLLLGLPRYLFAAALLMFPWADRPLPDRFSRKAVCVAQIAGLMALQLPLFSGIPAQMIVAAVSVALIWSFGRDVVWLWRTRA